MSPLLSNKKFVEVKISLADRVRNTDVLARVKKEVEVLYEIKRWKLYYFGHLMRNEKYRLFQLVMEGKIEGKSGQGRRKSSWLKNLRDWFGVDSLGLFRAAVQKVQIVQMIANLRRGAGT